jgi:hypothetical protein
VRTIEELLDRKIAASAYKEKITAVEINHTDHATPPYPKKLAVTSSTVGARSLGIVRSRTRATEFGFGTDLLEVEQLRS